MTSVSTDKEIAGEQRELYELVPVLPPFELIYCGQEGLYSGSSQPLVYLELVPRLYMDGKPIVLMVHSSKFEVQCSKCSAGRCSSAKAKRRIK